MKTNAERAWEWLTLTPAAEFTLERDGFIGAMYRPERDEYPGKAVVMFGGSDGIYPLTRLVAEEYVKRGMTILALAYWNEPGLPDSFEKVPVESVEKAALWLRGQGFVKKKGIQQLECSAFSRRGKDLPWARLKVSKSAILRDSLRERSVCLRSCYEDAVRSAPEEAQIKVENISGPVLLFYPEYDAMWPSELSAEKIRARLKEKNFSHPCKCVSYKYASHMLIPLKSRSTVMFRVERKYPEQCWESDMDALEKTLAFWKEVW